jgi:CRISPR-associated protein (TIGR03986 family)
VFEAATNSCFSIFEGGLLGKRERPENYDRTLLLTAGLIIDLPKNEDKPGCVKGMKYYKLNHTRFPKYKNNFRLNGEEILVAIVNDDVSDVKEYNKKEQIPDGYSISYLKTSDKGLPGRTRKMNEYVFLDDGSSENFELSYQTYQNYIISNRNNKQVHTKVPKSGDTIWFRSQEKKIKEFGYAQIYRKPFEKSIGDLLTNASQHLHPCSDYHKLCPSCRLFGWVHQQPSNDLERASYAGRVKISHADLIEEKGTLDDFPLAILSTPKPTTTFFYLLKNGKPDFYVKYDTSGAHLRGRKFYLHQKKAEEEKEYRRAGDIRDDQNRTIRDALKPGAKFEFAVEFENLAPVEFGALLWSIEMENDMFHKIGLGKPLGFGSVKLNIESIRILDVERRYGSFSNDGYNVETNQKEIFIKKFREYMEKRYGKNFYELDNIMDIKTILGEHALNIHYPRTSIEPERDGRNFQWFVNNKIFGRKYLKVAAEDTDGFPLNF